MARWLSAAISVSIAVTPSLLTAQGAAPAAAAPASSSSASASTSASAVPTSSAPGIPGTIEAAPEQVVWLRSGAVVRGRIVEFEPDRKVVLQLPTGEIRTIAWADVERASWVKTAPQASARPRASNAPAPRPAPSPAGSTVVRIFPNDNRIWLETRPGYDSRAPWSRVCQAPCDRAVETHERSLRIGGPALNPSNPFHVSSEGSATRLVVSPGKASTHAWGRGMLVSGVVIALASGTLYGVAKSSDKDGLAIAGLTGLIASGLLVLGALPVINAGRTTVKNGQGVRVGKAQNDWAF